MTQSRIWPDRWSIGPRKHGWPGMSFSVTFDLNSKQVCESITVMSYYGPEALPTVKMAKQSVGPFDEMTDLVQELIIESALQQYEQLQLDLD